MRINIQTSRLNKTWVLKNNNPVSPFTGFDGTFNNLIPPNPLYVEIINVQLEKQATTKDYIKVNGNVKVFLDIEMYSDGYLNYVTIDLIDKSGIVFESSSGLIAIYTYIRSNVNVNRCVIGFNFTNVKGEYKIRLRTKNNSNAWRLKASIYNIWLEKSGGGQ